MTEELDTRFEPFYKGLEYAPPTPFEEHTTKLLKEYIDSCAPLETEAELFKKSEMLNLLQTELNKWTIRKLESKGVIFDTRGDSVVACKILVSGSYRLGVTTQGADVDCVCCIPQPLDRTDFFDEEDGTVKLLRGMEGVTFVNPVLDARVPIIEVVWNGIDFDINCAVISRPLVPQKPTEVLDDQILIGMDEISRVCVNGPRVTEMIAKLVPNMVAFRLTLRVIRHWAKQRALYSNKMGFLGGVNWSLLVVFTCQLYPQAAPAVLVRNFFDMYCVWRWPTPIYLVHPYNVSGLEDVYNWEQRPLEQMPIITPAFPTMNSAFNVTKLNLNIMLKEFQRGRKICSSILQSANQKSWEASRKSEEEESTDQNQPSSAENEFKDLNAQELSTTVLTATTWAPLFAKSEFFDRYNDFVVISTHVNNKDRLDFWSGYVESRLRILIHEFDRFSLMEMYPFPQKFSIELKSDSQSEAPQNEKDKSQMENFSVSWFIAIRPHPINSKRVGGYLDLTSAAARWKLGVESWARWTEDMKLDIKLLDWKGLPDSPLLFPEGKAKHKSQHRMYMKITKQENSRLCALNLSENTPNLTGDDSVGKSIPSSTLHTETELEVSHGSDDTAQNQLTEKQLNIFDKRPLNETSNRGLGKIARANHDFAGLPIIPGIDPTRPVGFI